VAAAARALVGDDDGRKAAAAVGSVTVLGSVGPLSFIVLDQGRYGRPDPPRSVSSPWPTPLAVPTAAACACLIH
jgi:hypothetical protein